MGQGEKTVDGFRFLPPGLAAWVRKFIPDEEFKGFIPLDTHGEALESNDPCFGDQCWYQFKNRSSF